MDTLVNFPSTFTQVLYITTESYNLGKRANFRTKSLPYCLDLLPSFPDVSGTTKQGSQKPKQRNDKFHADTPPSTFNESSFLITRPAQTESHLANDLEQDAHNA